MATAVQPEVIWSPQPGPQTALLQCPCEDVFFGGARGGGKTDGLLGDFIAQAGRYGEASRGILFRRTYPELEEVERRSREILKPLGWDYNEQKHTWTAPNLATLRLRYLDRDADADNYQGHQYTWMGFDELGNWPQPDPIDKLWACLRSAHGVPCVRRSSGNPGGVGHAWVKARYITGRPAWHPFTYTPQTDNPHLTIEAVFIPSKLEDNPLLLANDPGYEHRLAATGSQALFKAWRWGDWDAVVGSVFGEWRVDLHITSDTWTVPPNWAIGAGLDFGYRAPGWVGLFACGPDGDVVCFDELYFRELHAFEAGRRAGERMKKHTPLTVSADSAMWQKTGVGPTQAEEFQRGLHYVFGGQGPVLVECTKGAGSRVHGWNLMHRYLAWESAEDGTVPPWKQPRLKFHPRCVNAIRTIPALPADPNNAEDVDTDAEDHPADGVRYFLMSRPAPGEKYPDTKGPDTHPGMTPEGRRKKIDDWFSRYAEGNDRLAGMREV